MSVPESITVSRLLPSEAEAAAEQVRELFTSAYPYDVSLPKDEHDKQRAILGGSEQVLAQAAEIENSGILDTTPQDAFVVAVEDGAQPQHDRIVGVGKFSRVDDYVVTIDGIFVQPWLRQRRVATAIVRTALDELWTSKQDLITAFVPNDGRVLGRFFLSLGLERVGGKRPPGTMLGSPPPADSYTQYQAPQAQFAAIVRDRFAR